MTKDAMTKGKIRVLVVEDHNVVRQGLVALLNVAEGLEVVGEAADGAEAVAQYRKHKPDITLVDLRLPRMSGVDVIQRVRMEAPQARFIVLTTYDGDEDIYRALKAGAKAYLLKGMTSEELISTIRVVHEGKSHIPPAIAERLAERMSAEELTPREFDLLTYLAARPGAVVTKQELLVEVWQQPYGSADKSVDVHVSWLRRKLGENAQEPRYLHTVRRAGVRLAAPADCDPEPVPGPRGTAPGPGAG